MSTGHDQRIQLAQQYATQAATVIGNLKAGSFDSASALALTSIAHSLSVIAAATARQDANKP